jgi:Xaa-Pro aminopeptidase
LLQTCLRGTAQAQRLAPADDVLVALRARKQPLEVTRILDAIETTLNIFGGLEVMIAPSVTEIELADTIRDMIRKAGATEAWDSERDPIVNFGPDAKVGPVAPGHTAVEPGMLIHIDLGIKQEGYCSDLQRM